jgi:DNA phosphorothioation-dependent restriction protein DptH
MNRLVRELANIVRKRVLDATEGQENTARESRFIFHGPPLFLLEAVFEELVRQGGIKVPLDGNNSFATLPVLLQMPPGLAVAPNPGIGISGKCDEAHLLDVRNNPNSPSFVALVASGQHNNKSVASTTEEFGLLASSNTGHSIFEDWWRDAFVQRLIVEGLRAAGLTADTESAVQLVRHAAEALDDMDRDAGSRSAVWRLIARLFSIPDQDLGLEAGTAIALACGLPPMQDGSVSSKQQVGILAQVAEEMADGFKTGLERLRVGSQDATRQALDDVLSHVQSTCDIPTAFERATEAFYLPSDGITLAAPPSWWSKLTTECWAELLSEQTEEAAGDLTIACTNPILPIVRGMPAIVRDTVELSMSVGDSGSRQASEILLTGGSFGKAGTTILVMESARLTDVPPQAGQKSQLIYKVESVGRKPATAKVISLDSWLPGILVTARMATKLSLPKKPRKTKAGVSWESSLSLPGSGRYELLLLVSTQTTISEAAFVPDDATEIAEDARKLLDVQEIRDGEYQVEIEAEGKYQLEIAYRRRDSDSNETCRVHITCEETKEEGCRSEFERLIKQNRQHLEKFDTKSVIQLDRNARLSSLQTWMLEEGNAGKSFLPLVIADDYSTVWSPPDWSQPNCPILSNARFLLDPRPQPSMFVPPRGFVEAREQIAARIRNSSDDLAGLVESAPLGKWLARDNEFRLLVEEYVDLYSAWLASDRDIACWVDVIAVCAREAAGRTLSRAPDAIILSPLHPLRLAWHCFAQRVLQEEVEGDDPCPCPAASILDPDCIPDLLTISLQAPGGVRGIDPLTFISVECNSDYWSVLWNGGKLGSLPDRSQQAPFDTTFGLTVGGISSGFSPAQVARALEDVSDLLAAKPVVSLVVSSAGGTTDACNDGLVSWCSTRFGGGEKTAARGGIGPRILEVFDTRPRESQPDQAIIANLSEDTANHVRWFERQPAGTRPDLGIIAQLDSAQPELTEAGAYSPISLGGLIRHRVRRQLNGAFLSESRQARPVPPVSHGDDALADKIANCIVSLEGGQEGRIGLQFAPDVHAVSCMLEEKNAGFVAVSSSAIDPACFLGGWFQGTYLWDYDLPSYSHRAGDTSGYYLLSQIRQADRDALSRVLQPLPGARELTDAQAEQILLEVARRGIPTVRGLSGDDTGATGDLGLFLAVRLLQDQFRLTGNMDSLLPVLSGSEEDVSIAIIVPVDPFRGYLADLARSVGKERKDLILSRPDLLVIGINLAEGAVSLQLTPVEVKCRQGSTFGANDSRDALGQAKALCELFRSIQGRASKSVAWRLAFQHLLLSMIGFGLRVYSRHHAVATHPARWATYHELIAAEILGAEPASICVDQSGRLIVVDSSPESGPRDHDGDGLAETIVISVADAGLMVSGNAQEFYDRVRSKVGDWRLLPTARRTGGAAPVVLEDLDPAGLGNSAVEDSSQPVITSDSSMIPGIDAGGGSDQAPTPSISETEPVGGAAPKVVQGVRLAVGKSVDGFAPRQLDLNISDTRLNQLNIGVVGDLGTGKTQLLKSLIHQISSAREENRGIKPRFLIFDYKRDYSSPEFVAATGARVVRPNHLPLNLFDTTSMSESVAPWLDRFRFFADVLDKIYTGIGPVQRDKLKGAVRNAYEVHGQTGRQPTIYDIHTEYRQLLGGKSDSPMAIIDDLVDMKIFEPDVSKTKTFDEFFDGVVVIALDALGQDDRSKNMLVAIMLNMFYENMLKTPKRPFEGANPQLRAIDSYLLVDEADNIMRYEFDVLRLLLLQGREFGAGVILASQYLRHFKAGSTDYREPLLTWFVHKVPNVTAAELSGLGITSDLGDLAERVKTLPNHHCLFKSFDVAGEVIRGLPFYELIQDKPKAT